MKGGKERAYIVPELLSLRRNNFPPPPLESGSGHKCIERKEAMRGAAQRGAVLRPERNLGL